MSEDREINLKKYPYGRTQEEAKLPPKSQVLFANVFIELRRSGKKNGVQILGLTKGEAERLSELLLEALRSENKSVTHLK